MPQRRESSNAVLVALAGIVALFTLFIVAWRFGTEERQPQSPLLTTISSPDLSQPATTTRRRETDTEGIGNPMTDPAMAAKASEPPKPKHVSLRIDVEGGDSWLRVVHADGTLVFDRTIVDGEKTFAVKGHGKQGFTIAGAGVPAYVTVWVNGDRWKLKGKEPWQVTMRGVESSDGKMQGTGNAAGTG